MKLPQPLLHSGTLCSCWWILIQNLKLFKQHGDAQRTERQMTSQDGVSDGGLAANKWRKWCKRWSREGFTCVGWSETNQTSQLNQAQRISVQRRRRVNSPRNLPAPNRNQSASDQPAKSWRRGSLSHCSGTTQRKTLNPGSRSVSGGRCLERVQLEMKHLDFISGTLDPAMEEMIRCFTRLTRPGVEIQNIFSSINMKIYLKYQKYSQLPIRINYYMYCYSIMVTYSIITSPLSVCWFICLQDHAKTTKPIST